MISRSEVIFYLYIIYALLINIMFESFFFNLYFLMYPSFLQQNLYKYIHVFNNKNYMHILVFNSKSYMHIYINLSELFIIKLLFTTRIFLEEDIYKNIYKDFP